MTKPRLGPLSARPPGHPPSIWENIPAKLAIIHAGDWLPKLLIITIIVTLWR